MGERKNKRKKDRKRLISKLTQKSFPRLVLLNFFSGIITLQKAEQFLGPNRIFHGIFPRKDDPVLTNGETNDLGDKSIEKEVKFKNMSYKEQ